MAYQYASDEKIREACGKYEFSNDIKKHLETYLDSRRIFHENESPYHSYLMKHDYEVLYTDLKHACHRKAITEADFFALTDLISDY